MSSRLIAATAMVLVGAACARGQRVAVDEDLFPAEPDSVFVEVFNDNFYDARIHAIYDGGARLTLGTVAGNGGRVETTLPWQPHPIVFRVAFIVAGTVYLSYPLDVARGDLIEVRLPPNIDVSGFFRRVGR